MLYRHDKCDIHWIYWVIVSTSYTFVFGLNALNRADLGALVSQVYDD